MELEFDKEIDAILRKGRDGRGVLVGDSPPEPKKHVDADTIAAFAEGALPERAKLLYVEHFADCDPCRRQLSQVIVMNRGADAAAASTASRNCDYDRFEFAEENWVETVRPSTLTATMTMIGTCLLGLLTQIGNRVSPPFTPSRPATPKAAPKAKSGGATKANHEGSL